MLLKEYKLSFNYRQVIKGFILVKNRQIVIYEVITEIVNCPFFGFGRHFYTLAHPHDRNYEPTDRILHA